MFRAKWNNELHLSCPRLFTGKIFNTVTLTKTRFLSRRLSFWSNHLIESSKTSHKSRNEIPTTTANTFEKMPPLSDYDDVSSSRSYLTTTTTTAFGSTISSSASFTATTTTKSILKQRRSSWKSQQQQQQQTSAMSPPPSSSTKTQRSITFNETVRVQPTLHVRDFTKSELRTTWYSQEEIASIRQQTKDMMKMLQRAQESQKLGNKHRQEDIINKYCIRGLEHRTRKGMKAKATSRMMGWDAVLNEQERQKEFGVGGRQHHDEESIAHLYKQTTTYAIAMALQRAKEDEEYVLSSNEGSSSSTSSVPKFIGRLYR